ncbi:MAG: RNA methyltransferase, partial [Chitinophagaceae bacterium]
MDELDRKTVSEFHKADKTPLVLLLENIRSMHNVGSVFRTADAFLLEGIFLCGYTPTPPHRDIHKTALGATETVQWKYFKDIVEAIKELRKSDYKILAVEQAVESISLRDFIPPAHHPLCLIFGNEVSGISENALSLCDGCIEIPQYGMKHSLNISVSAGMVVWEVYNKLKV